MNSVESVLTHYEKGETPPMNLVHGKFVKPCWQKKFLLVIGLKIKL